MKKVKVFFLFMVLASIMIGRKIVSISLGLFVMMDCTITFTMQKKCHNRSNKLASQHQNNCTVGHDIKTIQLNTNLVVFIWRSEIAFTIVNLPSHSSSRER